MLRIAGLESGYGDSRVLFGVDLSVEAGEAVALLGRNGMGKTTTVHSIFGLLAPRGGQILIDGIDVAGLGAYKIARLGLGLVPEGRQIFPNLTVEENVIATRRATRDRGQWTLPTIFRLFPRLAERRKNMGNQLSGGEQQMLAIARALMTNPRLIVLDEATEGLAPIVREEIWTCLRAIKREGTAILVIDRDVTALAHVVDRHAILEKGRIVWTGSPSALTAAPEIQERFLHV